jgi:hypothetical protein
MITRSTAHRAAAFSLLELVLSTAVTTILLLAVGSSMAMMSKALPSSSNPVDARVAAASVVEQMATELESATYITERSTQSITFVVPDRNGDGKSETIRYAWTGTSGDPLTRSYNSGAAVTVLSDVRYFSLTYTSKQIDETIPNTSGSTSTLTCTHYAISDVRIKLRSGNDISAKAETTVRTYNYPDIVNAAWDADFSTNPTSLDTLGSSGGDWVRHDGAAFSTTSLSGGLWTCDGQIDTRPLNSFTDLTSVEVKIRATSTAGTGAFVAVNPHWSTSTAGSIYCLLALTSTGTQTLTVYRKTASTTSQLLTTVPNLSSSAVTVRFLIDPSRDVFNVTVNGMQKGTWSFARFTQTSTSDKCVSLGVGTGSAGEFDNVAVRCWSSSP